MAAPVQAREQNATTRSWLKATKSWVNQINHTSPQPNKMSTNWLKTLLLNILHNTTHYDNYDIFARNGLCPRTDVRKVMCPKVKIEKIFLQSYELIVSMTQTKPFDKQVSSTMLLLCTFRPVFLVQSTGFSSLLC